MRIILWIVICSAAWLAGCGKPREHRYQGYVEGETVYLASPFSGNLANKYVERGQLVKKDEILCALDKNPQEILVKATEAELLQAKQIYKNLVKPRRPEEIDAIKAQVQQAEDELRLADLRIIRMRKLQQKQAIDKDSVDAAEAQFEKLTHLKEQYQANLALALQGARVNEIKAQEAQIQYLIEKVADAKWQLQQKIITAPQDGVVFDTLFKVGEFVTQGRPIISLIIINSSNVYFFVPAKALSPLTIGQEVGLSCEGCPPDAKAVLKFISPEAEYLPPLIYSNENQDKLVFRVQAQIQNAPSFKPGQPVTVITYEK